MNHALSGRPAARAWWLLPAGAFSARALSMRCTRRARRASAAGTVHVLQRGLGHLHAADRGVHLHPERLRRHQAGHLPVAARA